MRPYPLTADELADDLLSELDRVTETVRSRFGGLTDDQLAWQPDPAAWGVGHCLVHVARTNQLYREAVAAAFRSAGGRGAPPAGTLEGRWFGRLFTRLVGPDVKVRVKAPRAVRPRKETVEGASLETFLAEQHRVRGLVDEARSHDLDAVRVRSPFASWVRLTAGDALRVVLAHEERHLRQAERVAAHPRFPR